MSRCFIVARHTGGTRRYPSLNHNFAILSLNTIFHHLKCMVIKPTGSTATLANVKHDRKSSLSPLNHEPEPVHEPNHDDSDDDGPPSCLICLSSRIVDRTLLPACSHSQFCFECILRWADVKRRCPLCQKDIGSYVIHSIRGDEDQDYIRYHLRPQPDLPNPTAGTSTFSYSSRRAVVERVQAARRQRRLRNQARASPARNSDETSELEAALAFRRSIYSPQHLYAKHVGANRHTGYRSCPSTAVINRTLSIEPNGRLHRRISAFIRRELQVWPDIDHDFVTTYVLALTRVLPIGSDESVNLLAEFLGHANAIHFWHELECFLRSGKLELRNYDRSPLLQYDFLSRATGNSAASSSTYTDTAPTTPAAISSSVSPTPSRADIANLRRRTLLRRLEAEKAHLAKRQTSSDS